MRNAGTPPDDVMRGIAAPTPEALDSGLVLASDRPLGPLLVQLIRPKGMIENVRKLLQLLPDERWRIGGIAFATVITGLLQTVGIASVMPFLAVVSNPSIVTSNAYMAAAYEALGFQSTESFMVALGVFLSLPGELSPGSFSLRIFSTASIP